MKVSHYTVCMTMDAAHNIMQRVWGMCFIELYFVAAIEYIELTSTLAVLSQSSDSMVEYM